MIARVHLAWVWARSVGIGRVGEFSRLGLICFGSSHRAFQSSAGLELKSEGREKRYNEIYGSDRSGPSCQELCFYNLVGVSDLPSRLYVSGRVCMYSLMSPCYISSNLHPISS